MADASTEPVVNTDMVYVGPRGQESPVFGVLVPEQIYQAEQAFAAYLVSTHPDYWRLAAAEPSTDSKG